MVKVAAVPAAKPAAVPGTPVVGITPPTAKKKKMKRSDFPKWEDYCEYKKQGVLKRIESLTKKSNEWEERKKSETLGAEEKQLKKLAAYKAKIAEIEANLLAQGVKL